MGSMPDARYTLAIPASDTLGNPLVNLAAYAHQHIVQTRKHKDTVVEPGKSRIRSDGRPETVHHLVTIAEDLPETDGSMKQLAAYVGDVANHQGISCTKDSKNGPVHWHIDNPEFRPGQSAEPSVLAR